MSGAAGERPTVGATLAGPVRLAGVGLHSGRPVTVTLLPRAAPGIAFVREDLGPHPPLGAELGRVVDTARATTLGLGPAHPEVRVGTVEHLMAALWAAQIARLEVRLNGPELPALDGAAAAWLRHLAAAGRAEGERPAPGWRLARRVRVRLGAASATARPAAALAITYRLTYRHPRLPRRARSFAGGPAAFASELAPARTFVFAADLARLRAAGLAAGGSLGQVVVLTAEGCRNRLGQRFTDEPLRHKILDCLGDLALLGGGLRAHLSVSGGGHRLHVALAEALRAAPGALLPCA